MSGGASLCITAPSDAPYLMRAGKRGKEKKKKATWFCSCLFSTVGSEAGETIKVGFLWVAVVAGCAPVIMRRLPRPRGQPDVGYGLGAALGGSFRQLMCLLLSTMHTRRLEA